MFDYDWFHGVPYGQQQEESRQRCTLRHFPDLDWDTVENDTQAWRFHNEVAVRTLVYLRDGFSYELKEMAHVDSKSHLIFECEPVDEHYKVGSFVVTVPFDEIVRVETFAVHPSEKPEDMPLITGFRTRGEAMEHPREVPPVK
jgi:hypothetical protein